MPLTGTIRATLSVSDARSTAGGESATLAIGKEFIWPILSGTGANMADRVYTDTRTLAASATEDLDLAGALTNLYGVVTFAKIKAVFVSAAAANTHNVQVTRTVTTGALLFMADGDGIEIRPGGCFLWAAPGTGFTVTGAADDTLTITNSAGGTGVTYTIVVIGTSV